jgi:hypothetical protein
MLTLTILLVYTVGVAIAYAWSGLAWDVSELSDVDNVVISVLWPIVVLAYIWERIING